MKILTTLYLKSNILLLKHADGFLIGNEQFGTRLTQSFSIEDINDMIKTIKIMKKDVFIVCNQMMDDEKLKDFKHFVTSIHMTDVTGMIVADIGAIMVLKELGFSHLAVYHPETLHTNSFDFNYLQEEGILGAFVAKEITLEDILLIGKQKKYRLFLMGHGHFSMFYSKRHLLTNYQVFTQLKQALHHQQNLTLTESIRPNSPYPVLEDEAGTHVFRHEVVTSKHYFELLKTVVDYFIVDSIFKDDAYAMRVIDDYLLIHEDPNIKNDYHEVQDEGFYQTKTIYKK